MQFTLRQNQAASLAGLGVAASKDRARAILCGVLFSAYVEGKDLKLTFTVTDSYRLAQHFLTLDAEGQEFESFTALFDASQLVSILKKAKAKTDRVLITVEPPVLNIETLMWSKAVMEVRVFTNAGNLSCEIELIDGTFPKVDALMNPIPWDTNWTGDSDSRIDQFVRDVAAQKKDQEDGPDDVLENDDALDALERFISEARSLRDGGYNDPIHPGVALNGTYLSQMIEAIGAKGSSIPVQLLVRGGRQPMAFKFVEGGEVRGRGILMPVRI